MSRDGKGAASAVPAVRENGTTPAVADQWEADALAAISTVATPEEAETLLAKVKVMEEAVRLAEIGREREQAWGALRLKAERRYGELLPPKTKGGRPPKDKTVTGGHSSAPADRKGQERARKVAAVPEEDFEEYVKEAEKPTRDGLLRKAKKPTPPPPRRKSSTKKQGSVITGKAGLSHDPKVIEWVRDRYREDWTREQIVAASEAKTHGWPLPDAALTNGGVSECRAAIVAIERCEVLAARAVTRDGESRKRLRQFWALQREGDRPLLSEVASTVAEMTSKLSALDLENYDFDNDEVAWEFEGLYEQLVEFQKWMDTVGSFVDSRVSTKRKREMIRHMRENTSGMTVHERETSLRLADKLEAKLNGPKTLAG